MSNPNCPRTNKAKDKHPRYQNTVTLAFAYELEIDVNKCEILLEAVVEKWNKGERLNKSLINLIEIHLSNLKRSKQ